MPMVDCQLTYRANRRFIVKSAMGNWQLAIVRRGN